MEQMVDYLIIEPHFSDSPQRCFKLPFVVADAFISDSRHITNIVFNYKNGSGNSRVLDKLFSYIVQVPANSNKKLNPTLGGYLNKVVSFWLIKET